MSAKPKNKGFRFSKFMTDPVKEKEGTWVEISPGFKLKLARLNNPDFEAATRKKIKPYLQQIRLGDTDIPEVEDDTLKLLAEHILLAWDGLTDDNDEPIAYSREKAYELLKESKDFQRLVLQHAQNIENFRKSDAEQASGN